MALLPDSYVTETLPQCVAPGGGLVATVEGIPGGRICVSLDTTDGSVYNVRGTAHPHRSILAKAQ